MSTPALRISPVVTSSSNIPKRRILGGPALLCKLTPCLVLTLGEKYTQTQSERKPERDFGLPQLALPLKLLDFNALATHPELTLNSRGVH
jgi:hypothetical protein